jgi:hypothetical protein
MQCNRVYGPADHGVVSLLGQEDYVITWLYTMSCQSGAILIVGGATGACPDSDDISPHATSLIYATLVLLTLLAHLSVRHLAIFKSQWMESRVIEILRDQDKGVYAGRQCNKIGNRATWMPIETHTSAIIASREQLGFICRSGAMKG